VMDSVGFVPVENIVGKAERIFFSVDGQDTQLWQIWKWPGAIRFDRILMNLEPDHDIR
jgi:signal peptidase I